jgi:hypothetical protein
MEDAVGSISKQDLDVALKRWHTLQQQVEMQEPLRNGARAYRETLLRICSVLDEVGRKIPHPHGFFTAKEDRYTASLEISRGLGLLEEQVQLLRECIAFYGRILEHLSGVLAAILQTEAEWTLLLSQEKQVESSCPQEKTLPLDLLRKKRAEVETLMREIPDFCNTVSTLCHGTWTAFCLESSKTADIPHNGEGAQINALSDVLGAFWSAVGGLPQAPKEFE